jgi:hypothetical protein
MTTTWTLTVFVGGNTERALVGGICNVVVVTGGSVVLVVEVVDEVVVPVCTGNVVEVVVVRPLGSVVEVVVVVGFGTPFICTGLGVTEIATSLSSRCWVNAPFELNDDTSDEHPLEARRGSTLPHVGANLKTAAYFDPRRRRSDSSVESPARIADCASKQAATAVP